MSQLSDLVRHHYDTSSRGDLDGAVKGFAPDVVTETPNGVLYGIDAFRALGEAFLAAVPDQRMTIRHSYEAGETIVVEGDYAGTQTGDLVSPDGTIPASGRAFSFPFVDVLTVYGGEVVRHAIYWDNLGFLAQLGALGTPQPVG